jgi:tetratricopeptide (TPR) repeat protein
MRTDDLVQRALAALQAGRFAEAAQFAQQALDAAPDRPDAAKFLGYALISLERPKDAAAALERPAQNGSDSELAAVFAMALRRCNRADDAIIWFNHAISRKPTFPAAFYELAMTFMSLRRTDEAIDALKRGVEASPMSAEMVAQLGNLYYGANDRKQAADCFRRALALQPGHAAAHEALAMVLMHDHAFAEAADLFRRMLARDPANPHARIHLGNCLLGLGDRDGAYACFRTASAKGPLYSGKSLRILVGSPRGRFWLRPSAAEKFLNDQA